MTVKNYFKDIPENKIFTKNDIRIEIQNQNYQYSERAITWLLSEGINKHVLERVGKGMYVRLSNKQVKPIYDYDHSEIYKEIESAISKTYPLVTFQMWEMYQMNEFVNHLFGRNTIFVEVEKMLVEPVFETIHTQYSEVLFSPNKEMYYRQRGDDNTIVVQQLLSEAPKPFIDHTCPLEKLLVDLFSAKLTGQLISRSEYRNIYEDSFAKYKIDESKMFRYARRRNLEDKIKEFIQEETDIKLL